LLRVPLSTLPLGRVRCGDQRTRRRIHSRSRTKGCKAKGTWAVEKKKRYTSCSQQDQRWGSISDGFCQGGWHRVRPLPDGSHGRIHPFHRGRRFRGGIVQGLTRASNRFIAGFVFSRAAQTWVTAWRMRR
jgi:hypothetical protein